jgi:hypothetical protein
MSPFSPFAGATLPDLPRGVAVLNTVGNKAIRDGILGNPDVTMISIDDDWANLQPNETSFNTGYLDGLIQQITEHDDKSILLRLRTSGNSATNGGDLPDWVYTAMGVSPGSLDATYGVTYAFVDDDETARCIPVFWNPVYLAKKKAMIALAGAHFASNPAIKVVSVAYADAVTDDWNIPNRTDGDPSQLDLWLNPPPEGAGYTSQLMIDAAIHQGDATFTDGRIGRDRVTLTSGSAVFTQADVGQSVKGPGFAKSTVIATWINPTQVTLSKRATGKVKTFTIPGRRDGLIDVTMGAFPNQYITTSVNGNGPNLDAGYCSGIDPGICLPETVNKMAQTAYPGRYIVQRNNVFTKTPMASEATDAWRIIVDASADGLPVAGQALGVCWANQTSGYRMNGGNNCDLENPDCVPDPVTMLCDGDCALSYGQILQRSADRLVTYGPVYYEIYPPDASNLKDVVSCIHEMLTGGECEQGQPYH